MGDEDRSTLGLLVIDDQLCQNRNVKTAAEILYAIKWYDHYDTFSRKSLFDEINIQS